MMHLHSKTIGLIIRAKQYQGAYELFLSLVNRKKLSDTEVEDAILALDDLGFNIMPGRGTTG